MSLLQQINEQMNNAQAVELLNTSVTNGDKAGEAKAMRVLTSAVGAAKAQTMLDAAKNAVAEKNTRESKMGLKEAVASRQEKATAAAKINTAVTAFLRGEGGKKVVDDAVAAASAVLGADEAKALRDAAMKAKD